MWYKNVWPKEARWRMRFALFSCIGSQLIPPASESTTAIQEELLKKHTKTDFDLARDELLSHIHRCGVLKASSDQQDQWLTDTMEFMSERYADLSEDQVEELRQIGRRFCQPVIARGSDNETSDSREVAEQDELAGAA